MRPSTWLKGKILALWRAAVREFKHPSDKDPWDWDHFNQAPPKDRRLPLFDWRAAWGIIIVIALWCLVAWAVNAGWFD